MFASDCAAELLIREMSSVQYVYEAAVPSGARTETGRCTVQSSLSFRSRKIWSKPTQSVKHGGRRYIAP